MESLTIKKIGLTSILTIIGIVLFYWFMTYDRNYSWSKDFSYQLDLTIKNTDFKVISYQKIDPKNVKRPTLKSLKLFLQKGLNKIGLMNFGREYGEEFVLKSKNPSEKIIFKGLFIGDHLIGLEVECENRKTEMVTKIKNNLEEQFPNYNVIWTEK